MQYVGLITGASSGIGKELARIHAERKRDLVIVARRKEELQELKEELEGKHGVTVKVIAKDLTAPAAAKEIFQELEGANITVDYLFNNAGFGGRGLFHEQDWGMLNGMIDLNVTALTELTHRFLPGMVQRGRGKILNTSSTAGFMPGPLQAVYFATKAYVNSFSQAVASEVENSGVTVTALCPGAVKTEFGEVADMDDTDMFENARSPRYTAERGYEAMEAGKLEVITETGLKVMIKGAIPFIPKRVGLNMIKKMQS
ncbi:SDR family oxidoreductase [Lewinella sp. W8]|uniref:SDR family NAD(P)-dependent oxidoreductase n=1 Tax=Lewinella sp. W8 TaxID=2528208 RepID=UPI00106747A8|nr:SDR family oxidoreductase [Lewinella sp. W8]MTB53522.1 SDR family NAD(P)-dependent oxidoreductase [Lewinella sp. W8]